MGAAGASYGGYMILWIAGHSNRFKVLVDTTVSSIPPAVRAARKSCGSPIGVRRPPVCESGSLRKVVAVDHVSDWKTPLLVVHGQLDYRVDLSEGLSGLYGGQAHGPGREVLVLPRRRTTGLLRPRNRRIWWAQSSNWLEVHLHESAHP